MTPTETLQHLGHRLHARAKTLDAIGHDLHEPIRKLLHAEAYECRRDAEIAFAAAREPDAVQRVPLVRRVRGLRLVGATP